MIGVSTKSGSTGRDLGEIGNGAKDLGTSVPVPQPLPNAEPSIYIDFGYLHGAPEMTFFYFK